MGLTVTRDRELSPEESTRLLDPAVNNLIPGGDEGQAIQAPNDLCPGYVVPNLDADALADALANVPTLGAAGVTLAEGLRLEARECGGLAVFKGGRPVRDLTTLDAGDLLKISSYVARIRT